MGKGSNRRPYDKKKFDDAFDKIFKKSDIVKDLSLSRQKTHLL